MGDYTKVVIETDSAGRMNISALDDAGSGHGYRLAGPKYVDDIVNERPYGKAPARPAITIELGERDVKELRSYLEIWDAIQARNAASGA